MQITNILQGQSLPRNGIGLFLTTPLSKDKRLSRPSATILCATNMQPSLSTVTLQPLLYLGSTGRRLFLQSYASVMQIFSASKRSIRKASVTTSVERWRTTTIREFSGQNQGLGQWQRRKQNSLMGVQHSTRIASKCLAITGSLSYASHTYATSQIHLVRQTAHRLCQHCY